MEYNRYHTHNYPMKARLIYVCQSFDETNGWGRLARSMAREAIQAGHEVYVSAADGTTVEGAHTGPCVFDIHASAPRKILQAIKWWHWLWRLPPSPVPTTLHVFSEPHMWLVLGAGSINSVGTLCGTYVDPKQHGTFLFQWAFRMSLDRAHHLVAISEYTRSRVDARWRERVKVVPLGVSHGLLTRPWKSPQDEISTDYKVVSVGAVKPRKGFLELIRGFHAFLQMHPEKTGKLTIVGSMNGNQSYSQLLKNTIRELGCEQSVHLTGSVSDEELYGWYRWCDVFALTPIDDGGGFEGFGLVYLEANLFGKVCLGVAATGGTQAISPDSGVIVSGVEPDVIAAGLERLFSASRPTNPLAWANAHTWDKVFSIYTNFYT